MQGDDNSTLSSLDEMEEFPPDIDALAKSPAKNSFQEDFIKEKTSKQRIAESQETTRSFLAIFIMTIYAGTLIGCFVIAVGLEKEDRQEILTLLITSQATLLGGALGFYFGKNQS